MAPETTETYAIFVCILLQLQQHYVAGQRPMLNSSTAPSSIGSGSPAPSFMPTPRPRSDVAQMVYKPSPPESTSFSNPRTGKYLELKEQIRKNGTHFNSPINHFHDSTYIRANNKMTSPIDRLRKLAKMNKTQVANTMGDTPDFRPYRNNNKNDPLRNLQNNFRQTVSLLFIFQN